MKRHRHHEDEADNTERWMVSYADFVTLLFAFFVVMYSMSSINDGKYRVLSDTMVAAFHTPPKSTEPIQLGKPQKTMQQVESVLEKPKLVIKPQQVVDQGQTARIATDIKSAMQPLIDKNLIKVTYDKLWVEVELSNSILFPSAEADLQPDAYPILKKLAGVLKDLPNHIDVEGHTDNLPIRNELYRSNWELSASRAASVVHLLARNGIAPIRMAAIGYGEYRPVADNSTAAGRRRNRRVVMIILADKNARRMLEIERQAGRKQQGSRP